MSAPKRFELTIKVADGDTAVGFLQKPSRVVIARAMSLIAQNKPFEAGEFVLENCLLDAESDARLRDDDDVRMSATMQALQAIQLLDGELKKL